jgi:TIR domain
VLWDAHQFVMANTFISYSRKDQPFVRQLQSAIAAQNRTVWVDWQDILPTAEWWEEIQQGIDDADNFLFVISPNSARSRVCTQEIDYAVIGNKRLIPIVYREVQAPDQVHPALGRHNWIFFRESDSFDQALTTLMTAIDTDLDYLQYHKRIWVKAKEWERKQNDSFLLRGQDLKESEAWLQNSMQKQPTPTHLHMQYIKSSRQIDNVNQRLIWAGRGAIALVTVGLAFVGLSSWWSWNRVQRSYQEIEMLKRDISFQERELQVLRSQLAKDRGIATATLERWGADDTRLQQLKTSGSAEELAEQFQQAKAADDGYQKTLAQLQTGDPAVKATDKATDKAPDTEKSDTEKSDTKKSDTKKSDRDRTPSLDAPPIPELPLPAPLPPRRSQAVSVQFDPTGINAATIGKTLTKLGFTHSQRSVDSSTPRQTEPAARTIYYQPETNPDQVKIIAFTFLRAGVPIAAIQPFPPDSPTATQIEIMPVSGKAKPLTSLEILQRSLPLP